MIVVQTNRSPGGLIIGEPQVHSEPTPLSMALWTNPQEVDVPVAVTYRFADGSQITFNRLADREVPN